MQDNVLVSDQGRALLHDFGLSSIMSEQKKHDDPITNTLWLAPELKSHSPFKGPRKLTMESDMYAFGSLLYEVGYTDLLRSHHSH